MNLYRETMTLLYCTYIREEKTEAHVTDFDRFVQAATLFIKPFMNPACTEVDLLRV